MGGVGVFVKIGKYFCVCVVTEVSPRPWGVCTSSGRLRKEHVRREKRNESTVKRNCVIRNGNLRVCSINGWGWGVCEN